MLLADKGYCSAENDDHLAKAGLTKGLMKKSFLNRPLSEADKTANRLISTVRYKVERAFGSWKKDLGFSQVR